MSLHRKQSFIDNFAALRTAREPIDSCLVNATLDDRAKLARWYDGTTHKLTGQSFELEGRVADTLAEYAECLRLNPDDAITRNRLNLLRKVYGGAVGSR